MSDNGTGWKTELLLDGSALCTMSEPKRKVLLWHVAAGCNISCKYCYGSFDGSSYKDSYRFKKVTLLDRLLLAAEDLASAGFQRAHICGGEPFLFGGIWKFLDGLQRLGIERYVLSNGTFLPAGFDDALERGLFTNLSFSIDSLNPSTNDSLRGRTSDVLRTIRHTLELREQKRLSLEIGLYIVLTRANIRDVNELLEQIIAWGFDFATVQICYLPESHPEKKSLELAVADRAEVLDILSRLRKQATTTFRVPGDPFFALSESIVTPGSLVANNCFADRGRFLFIDSEGNVRPCATRGGVSSIIGNIQVSRLKDFLAQADQGPRACHDVCGDCLGAWEMAHPAEPHPTSGSSRNTSLGHSHESPGGERET